MDWAGIIAEFDDSPAPEPSLGVRTTVAAVGRRFGLTPTHPFPRESGTTPIAGLGALILLEAAKLGAKPVVVRRDGCHYKLEFVGAEGDDVATSLPASLAQRLLGSLSVLAGGPAGPPRRSFEGWFRYHLGGTRYLRCRVEIRARPFGTEGELWASIEDRS